MNKKMCNLVIAIALASFTIPTLVVSARPLRIIAPQTKVEQRLANNLRIIKETVYKNNSEQIMAIAQFNKAATDKKNQIKNLEKKNQDLRKQISGQLIMVAGVEKKVKMGEITYTEDQFAKIAAQEILAQSSFKDLNKDIKLELVIEKEKNFALVLSLLDNHIATLTEKNIKLEKLNLDVYNLLVMTKEYSVIKK